MGDEWMDRGMGGEWMDRRMGGKCTKVITTPRSFEAQALKALSVVIKMKINENNNLIIVIIKT